MHRFYLASSWLLAIFFWHTSQAATIGAIEFELWPEDSQQAFLDEASIKQAANNCASRGYAEFQSLANDPAVIAEMQNVRDALGRPVNLVISYSINSESNTEASLSFTRELSEAGIPGQSIPQARLIGYGACSLLSRDMIRTYLQQTLLRLAPRAALDATREVSFSGKIHHKCPGKNP
jgi:hypothetical protein